MLQARDVSAPMKPPDESIASRLIVINSALAALALVTVVLRVYVRSVVLKTFGTDDGLMIAAMIGGILVLVCWIGECHAGMGRHYFYLSSQNVENMAHWLFFHTIIIAIAISLTKMSAGFVILRFVHKAGYKRFTWVMIIFLIPYTMAYVLAMALSCIPPAGNWSFSVKATAKCYSTQTLLMVGVTNTTINIITDIIFAVLPIPVILALQLKMRKKIMLIVILSLASVWNPYNIWNSAELFLGISAASLPASRPLFKAVLKSTYGQVQRVRTSNFAHSPNVPKHQFFRQEDHPSIELHSRGVVTTATADLRARDFASRSMSPDQPFVNHPSYGPYQGILLTTAVTVTTESDQGLG